MGIETGMYAQFAEPPRSIGDYQNENNINQQNRLALALQKQKSDEYTRSVDDANKLRGVVSGFTDDRAGNQQKLLGAGRLKEAEEYGKGTRDAHKAELENKKAELEQHFKTFDLIGQITTGVRDQATWDQARQQTAQLLGSEAAANLPQAYDPAFIEQQRQKAMPIKEQLAAEHQRISDELAGKKFAYEQTNDEANRGVTIRGQNITAGTAGARLAFDKSKDQGIANPMAPAQQGGNGTDAIVQAIIDGRKTLTPAEMKSSYGQNLLGLVAQKDPSFDQVNFSARSKTRNDFVAGKSAENIKSINTAIAHLGQLNDQMTALNNSDSPTYNTVANWLGKNTGNRDLQTKLASADATAEGVAGEMAKVFRSTGMSEHEIDAWRKKFDGSTTPGAQQGTMQAAIHMLQGRMGAIADQYKTGMGTTAQPLTILTPESQSIVERLSGKKAVAPVNKTNAGATVSNW